MISIKIGISGWNFWFRMTGKQRKSVSFASNELDFQLSYFIDIAAQFKENSLEREIDISTIIYAIDYRFYSDIFS